MSEQINENAKMPEAKKHWRLLTDKSFIVGDMITKDVTLTIKSVEKGEVQTKGGKEMKPIISFEETKLKMIANITNLKTIAKVCGSPFTENWIGKKITLYSLEAVFFGEKQKALRVREPERNIKPIQS